MRRWPSWRFEQELDRAEAEHNRQQIAQAKREAEQALQQGQAQLAEVRRLAAEHKPIRDSLRTMRTTNRFAEGFRRVIEEGR